MPATERLSGESSSTTRSASAHHLAEPWISERKTSFMNSSSVRWIVVSNRFSLTIVSLSVEDCSHVRLKNLSR